MAVSVQVHNLIASLTNAAKKGDLKAVAKWARELAVLADPAPVPPPVVVPAPVTPTGMSNWAAAQLDAGFVFLTSQGDNPGADTNPAPGAAAALGFTGVVAGNGYGVFKNGVLVETVPAPPAGGWPFAFGLAPGFLMDAPYTGPGAVRP